MGKYRYNTFMEYLPKRYSATVQQARDRQEIYQFKDGNCSERIQDGIIHIINSLNILDKSNWCVCFIPASTNFKTRRRYSDLSTAITKRTGIECSYTAIYDKFDHESGHLSGKNLIQLKILILILHLSTKNMSF